MLRFWRFLFELAWICVSSSLVSAGIACLSNPCSHGICIDDVNSTYSCYCVDGFTGVHCQTNWDECWSSPCENGGTCVDGVASYNCTCPEGFIGDNCETNYNECESNPCMNNGTCIDLTNGYVCSCVPGYSGQHCEVDEAVCNSTEEVRCYNGGQCVEGPGFKFYCKCSPGWKGSKCEDQIDECESDPCQNGGVCIDMNADYMCACSFGYTGKSCETQIHFCDRNSCSNDALCVVEEGARVCYCVPDYHGENCELQYDECLLGPRCMNGGTCIDGVDNFTCSCPPTLTGKLCECLILDNNTYDCEYVSPTSLPISTQSVLLTTLYNEITTTEIISTSAIYYNDTIPRTKPSDDSSTDLTSREVATEMITIPPSTVEEDVTKMEEDVTKTVYTETTTSTTLTYLTTQVESETNSGLQVETTTERKESCESFNGTTTNIFLPEDLVTTERASTATTIFDTTTIAQTNEADVVIPIVTVEPTVSSSTSGTSVTEITKVTTEAPTTNIYTITDKMFTDSPIEHPVTENPTLSESTSQSATTTSNVDVTTNIYTTVQSACTDSICNYHGNCVNTLQGIGCHCAFNYKGKFCEDKITITSAAFGGNSFITHKLKNSTLTDIAFNAKTLLSDGQLIYVDIAKGVYMQLYMNSGLLQFKFSCGYQTMLLSELKTFVNKGYEMRIETRLDLYPNDQYCNATLRLNDTVAMSGGQIANITFLETNATLYLGSMPNFALGNEIKPFIGCIKDLMVNGEDREIFGKAIEAGEVSECSSLACLSTPCHNGGSCSDAGQSYACSCTNGWTGKHCNQSVCEHNPCQSGGSCVKHPGSGFLCMCPYGKHGIFCEYNVEITRPSLAPISTGVSSYLVYALSQNALNSDRFDLRLRFQAPDMDQIALLAFIGQNGRHDSRSQHLALTFVKGYLMLTWNMGNGPRRIFTSRALGPNRAGHAVRVWRRGRNAGLSVDARFNASGNAPAHDSKMTVTPYLYIGGHPSLGFSDLPHDLPLHSGWRGCIWEVGGQALGKPAGGRGVGQCGVQQCTSKSCNAPRGVCIHSPATYGCICNEGWFGPKCSFARSPCDRSVTRCKGQCVITASGDAQCDCPYGKAGINCDQDLIPTDVLFTGIRSFVRLYPREISSVSLALEAEIKPTKERGLIAYIATPHFYTALSIQGGLLEYRWTERVSGVTSVVRSGAVVSLGGWRGVRAGRYGRRLYVWADGTLSAAPLLAHAVPHTAAPADVLLGGAADLSTLPFDIMSGPPEPYTGCIRNLHINNIFIPLEKQNIQDAQNLQDCDGTLCGGEVCGSGSCTVEDGRAQCICGTNNDNSRVSSGGRCRRATVQCNDETCGAGGARGSGAGRGGRCVRGRCVCLAGRAGANCEHQINITIPQFTGDSLLSLGHKAASNRVSEQRVSGANLLRYITLNFTTAELNGLLLWIDMGEDYFGLGIENGHLKLVWCYHNNSTEELTKPTTVLKLLPHAGYIADAEWHFLVLRLEKPNITLTVDDTLVYVEEMGLYKRTDYKVQDLYIGGVSENNGLARKIFPHNFKGCIDNITTEENSYLTNYTEIYSENVKSCQLLPIN